MDIENNYSIQYTKGDTFRLSVSSENDVSSGTGLKFVIVSGDKNTVIEKECTLNDEGKFIIELTEQDIAKLGYGSYSYKITLYYPDGFIATQISGTLIVKWGV